MQEFFTVSGMDHFAEALRGHGERAFNYFIENAPAAQNNRAEIRRLEPYRYGQFLQKENTARTSGRSHVHWLTGTASTVMVGCVEGILGMRPGLLWTERLLRQYRKSGRNLKSKRFPEVHIYISL